MPTKTTKRISPNTPERGGPSAPPPIVVSVGCPSGVGPEVAIGALRARGQGPILLVGAREVLLQSAEVAGFSRAKLERAQEYHSGEGAFSGLRVHTDFDRLRVSEMRPGRPSKNGGLHQLSYIEAAFKIAKKEAWPLSTAPVSKEVIAGCGVPRARAFRGHTEWLEKLDHAPHSVMCFSCEKLTTSLVTTHIPLRRVSTVLSASLVMRAILELADLLLRNGHERPLIAVCSLNPHAGEGELLGDEENRAIVPALKEARRRLRSNVRVVGPVGAETAYRKGAKGVFAGVVAMYHDQATIPMKLLDFGGAVNITQGLSIVRTSVDHGTAYDIAGQGVADPRGMREAIVMARALGASTRRIPHGAW